MVERSGVDEPEQGGSAGSSEIEDINADGHCRRQGFEALWIILWGTFSYLGLIALIELSGADVLLSDPGALLEWSRDLLPLKTITWLPLYSVLLRLAAVVTLGLLPGPVLLYGVNYLCWIFLCIASERVFSVIAPRVRQLAVILICFYPFVGLGMAVTGRQDTLALAALMTALYLFLCRRWVAYTFVVAFGLLTHKALLPVYFLMSLSEVLKGRYSVTRMLLSGVPLSCYYLVGLLQFENPMWLVMHHLDHVGTGGQAGPTTKLPFLDALIGPLASGGTAGAAKGAIVVTVSLLAVVLATMLIKARRFDLLAFAAPTILMALVLNRNEAWGLFRYSVLLVIPAVSLLRDHRLLVRLCSSRKALVLVIAVLTATQAAWVVYCYHFYLVFHPVAG